MDYYCWCVILFKIFSNSLNRELIKIIDIINSLKYNNTMDNCLPLTKLKIDHQSIHDTIERLSSPWHLAYIWDNDEEYHELRINDWLDIKCVKNVAEQLPLDLSISSSRIVAEMLDKDFILPAHKDGTRQASIYIPLTALDCPLELYNENKMRTDDYYHDVATLINAQSYHGTRTGSEAKLGLQFSLYEDYSILKERLSHLV